MPVAISVRVSTTDRDQHPETRLRPLRESVAPVTTPPLWTKALVVLRAGQLTCGEAVKQRRVPRAALLAPSAEFPNGRAVAVAVGALAGNDGVGVPKELLGEQSQVNRALAGVAATYLGAR
jgi:hypothetical protein